MFSKISETIRTWKLILARTRKPMKDEFYTTLRIVLLAILAVGAVGFIINLAAQYTILGVR